MRLEQQKETSTLQIKMQPSKSDCKKYLGVDQVLYILSNEDEEPNLRLHVPSHMKGLVIRQYLDHNGHPGTQRLFAKTKSKCFWHKYVIRFACIRAYVSTCDECQTISLTRVKAPLRETNIAHFPFYYSFHRRVRTL